MIKPISPVEMLKITNVKPDEVIQVFNDLIHKYWDGRQARIGLDEAAGMVAKQMGISTKEVFDHRYLDVEAVYRDEGWLVEFNQPGYNEDYPSVFTFSLPLQRFE